MRFTGTLALVVGAALACAAPEHLTDTETADPGTDSTGVGSSTGSDTNVTGGATDTGATGDTDDTDDTGDTGPECAAGGGEPGGSLEWSLAGTELSGSYAAIAVGPTGDVVLVGLDGATGADALVEVRDASGALQWSDVYGGTHGLLDRALDVGVDGEGFIHVLVVETVLLVSGESSQTLDARLVVLRYGPDGEHVWRWERERPPVEPWQEYLPSGQIDVEGDAIRVLARAWDEPASVIRLDRFGNAVSETPLATPAGVRIDRHDLGPGGAAYLAGRIESPPGDHDLWIGGFTPDGSLAWSDRFGSLDDRSTMVVADAQDSVVLAWSTSLPMGIENHLRRYDAAGAPAWTLELPLTGYDSSGARAGAIRCDGSLLLTGSTDRPLHPNNQWGIRTELWVAAVSFDGVPLWDHLHPFGELDSLGGGNDVVGVLDGDVLVVGSFSDEDYLPWFGRFAGG